MSHHFKANDLTHPADRANLNQWVVNTNAEITALQKLIKTLTVNKIDAEPDKLTVTHVNIYQHFADPSETQTLTAASTIMPLGENLPIQSETGIALTSTPQIYPPDRQGQILFIHNVGAYLITFQDEANFAGSNLRLHGALFDLDANEAAIFMEVNGEWVLHGFAVSSVHLRQMRVTGDAIFTGYIYQSNPSKAVDMQNMILRGTATITDQAGFRAAIDAAQRNHVHDFTASGTITVPLLGYDGLDGMGVPTFSVNPTDFTITLSGTTSIEHQP